MIGTRIAQIRSLHIHTPSHRQAKAIEDLEIIYQQSPFMKMGLICACAAYSVPRKCGESGGTQLQIVTK